MSLIHRVKTFDSRAWERFSLIYCPLVLEWVVRAGVKQPDASDVVQEVFMAVANGIHQYQALALQPSQEFLYGNRQKFRAWLWGITRHKIADQFRKQSAAPVAHGGSAIQHLLHDLADPNGVDESVSRFPDEEGSVLRRALEIIKVDFEESTWRAFWMVTVDGKPAKEVAQTLGLTLGAVYTAKSRVLSLLRHELRGLEELP